MDDEALLFLVLLSEWYKIAIQSWHWKGMYTASEDEV